MKRYGSKEYILGVTASHRAVHAVLVQDAPDGPIIVQQFQRSRNSQESFAPLTQDLEQEKDSGISLRFGAESVVDSPLFLAAEFGSTRTDATDAPDVAGSAFGGVGLPFDLELLDIVSECRDAGYNDFSIVFSLGSAFISTTALELAATKKSEKKDKGGKKNSSSSKRSAPSRDEYVAALESVSNRKIDPLTTAFVPLKCDEGVRGKSLAIVPLDLDPVTPTLQIIRDRKRPLPAVDLLDNEITLFLGLARAAYLSKASTDELDYQDIRERDGHARILFVRAGMEDTLVMFIEGEELIRFENLRSITSFDPPETIFSRVLLLQDEFGIGDADMVVILGEDREEALIETFRNFFSGTWIESARRFLPPVQEAGGEPLSREGMLAAVATLRMVSDELFQYVFDDVNMLPRKLLKRRLELPFSWPIAAMYVVIFAASLFFVYRYYTQLHELELYRYELKHFPEEVIQANSQVLQGRIDALRTRTSGYVHSLDVLDSLLLGSDKWSRALETTAALSLEVTGVWIETWDESGGYLRLEGTATDRNDVVDFASRSQAIIETLTFSTIRDWPVYSFTISIPLPDEMPEATVYLRGLVESDRESVTLSPRQPKDESTSSD